mmetsp:Transcript_1241/g.3144  ORF Transcript_1241/g.3144 Transcript_1241/m.3144 type:complete len:249 (+) Transcript_1241:425-1171(+)
MGTSGRSRWPFFFFLELGSTAAASGALGAATLAAAALASGALGAATLATATLASGAFGGATLAAAAVATGALGTGALGEGAAALASGDDGLATGTGALATGEGAWAAGDEGAALGDLEGDADAVALATFAGGSSVSSPPTSSKLRFRTPVITTSPPSQLRMAEAGSRARMGQCGFCGEALPSARATPPTKLQYRTAGALADSERQHACTSTMPPSASDSASTFIGRFEDTACCHGRSREAIARRHSSC